MPRAAKSRRASSCASIPKIAPVQAGIFPLARNKPELVERARHIERGLRGHVRTQYDEGQRRPTLSPSGRDRHAVLRDGGLHVARGRHGYGAGPRYDAAGAGRRDATARILHRKTLDGDPNARRDVRARAAVGRPTPCRAGWAVGTSSPSCARATSCRSCAVRTRFRARSPKWSAAFAGSSSSERSTSGSRT